MKYIVIMFLFTTMLYSQQEKIFLHLGGGIVDISNREDGDAFTFDLGMDVLINDVESVGIASKFRYAGVRGANFNSFDILPFYRVNPESIFTDIGIGMSYNDLTNDFDAAIMARVAIPIQKYTYVYIDLTNVSAQKNIMYLTLGFKFRFVPYNGEIRFF